MADVDVSYDPFAPGYVEDPYRQFAALREHDPVHQTPFGAVYVSRWDDVFALLRDPSLSVEQANAAETPLDALAREALGDDAALLERERLSMLDRDPPDHDRLRRLVSRAFTPRRVAALRPRIESLVDERLDRVEPGEPFEVIGGLAFPLPFDVIVEMLGFPEELAEQADRIRDLSGTLVRSLEPVVDPDVLRAIAAAGEEMGALIDGLIAWKREHPGDDLLTTLIEAEVEHDDGTVDRLGDDELAAQVSLLFIAGHETTVNLIGNGLHALVRHPDQLALLRDDPSLLPNAIDELLRWDPPVQMTRRIPVEPIRVGGVDVPAGVFVVCALASANRDEAHFGPTAADLDVTRADAHDHLAFGGGTHYCLGASLAKLEAQVAIGRLLERFGTVELASAPTYNGRINLRGLDELHLHLA